MSHLLGGSVRSQSGLLGRHGLLFFRLNGNEGFALESNQIESSFCLLSGKGVRVCKFALHLISPKVTLTYLSVCVENVPFALASIIAPLSVVNLEQSSVEHPSTALLFAINVFTNVNVARWSVHMTPVTHSSVRFPSSLIH